MITNFTQKKKRELGQCRTGPMQTDFLTLSVYNTYTQYIYCILLLSVLIYRGVGVA
jgi:hypothetical protein